MHDSEDAFATDPSAILVLDAAIVQNGGFVEIDAPAVDLLGEDEFVSMEVIPT